MAIQILPQNYDLGSSLGTGLSQSLQGLAQTKMQQLQQRNLHNALVQGGINPQHATILSQLTPQERTSFFQRLGGQDFSNAGQEEPLNDTLQQLGMQQEEYQAQQPQQQQPQQQQQLPALTGKDALMRAIQEASNRQQPQQEPQQQQKLQSRPTGVSQQGTVRTQKAPSFAEIAARPTPEQQLKIAALNQARQQHLEKLSATEQREVDKETKPVYDEVAKGYKAAKENNIRLVRMEELVKKGDLSAPAFSAVLDTLSRGIEKIGLSLDLRAIQTADSQEFAKLSADFIKSAKDFFGGRVTDADLKAFLQTVPNLLQSDEGKLRVIHNLRMFNDIAILKKKAAEDIIKENGGRRPRNFESLLDERTESQIDAIADKFRKGIKAPKKGFIKESLERIPIASHLARGLGVL